MSTLVPYLVANALFPRTRQAVLGLLFGHPDRSFYLREIAASVGGGLGQVQRELKQLSDAGIIRRFSQGQHVYFQADSGCPVFEELRGLVTKTVGAAGALSTALELLADKIAVAFVHGSVARGQQQVRSDIDLFIVGDVSFREVTMALRDAETDLRREINPTVYPPAELQNKLAAGNHFLRTVMKAEKIFVIGGEDELGKLAQ
ncbi:MAG: nucleotidyltransferase domain-containing protein [Pirellulales bacterium]